MPRKPRQWHPGATYHIMARGNHRQPIIHDDSDCAVLVESFRVALERFATMLHSFCIMTNHYHLLVETTDKPIWLPMKRIDQCYAAYFNSKYGLCGHLFQGRYRSCLVRDDTYFIQTSRYIHLNPVKAGMVLRPEDYRWSSYRTFIGQDRYDFVRTEKVLGYFQDDRVSRYRDFVEGDSLESGDLCLSICKEMGEDDEWLPW